MSRRVFSTAFVALILLSRAPNARPLELRTSLAFDID